MVDAKINILKCISEKNISDCSEIFKNKEEFSKFLCYFGLFSDYNTNNLNDQIKNLEFQNFIDLLFTKLNEENMQEYEIIAFLKIVNFFILHVNIFFIIEVSSGKEFLLKNYHDFAESIFTKSSQFFKNGNYSFLILFMKEFFKIFACYGETLENSLNNYSINIYNISNEIFDNYLYRIINNDVPLHTEEAINLIKENIIALLKQNNSTINGSINNLILQVFY